MEKFYRPRLDCLEEAIATYNADQTYRNAKVLMGLRNKFWTEEKDFKMSKKVLCRKKGYGSSLEEGVSRLKRIQKINQAINDILRKHFSQFP
jgi:hypothetical protein